VEYIPVDAIVLGLAKIFHSKNCVQKDPQFLYQGLRIGHLIAHVLKGNITLAIQQRPLYTFFIELGFFLQLVYNTSRTRYTLDYLQQ
jgi:hypothetical protein